MTDKKYEEERDRAAQYHTRRLPIDDDWLNPFDHFKEGADWATSYWQKEIEELGNKLANQRRSFEQAVEKRDELIGELEKAVMFYGNRSNWKYTCGDEVSSHYDEICGDPDLITQGRNYYGGHKAREALEKLKAFREGEE